MSGVQRTELTGIQLEYLRINGYIASNEVAYLHGDLLIVENAITHEKRVLENHSLVLESNRRILKG